MKYYCKLVLIFKSIIKNLYNKHKPDRTLSHIINIKA